MIAFPTAVKIPLAADADGVIRVSNTRVPLETLIAAYKQGDSPEQIVEDFDVLNLADVYAVITYYLQHQADVEDYIRQQDEKSAQIRREIEANHPEMLAGQAKFQAVYPKTLRIR